MISMMGASRSGKTSYLIALYYEVLARQEEDERWSMEALNARAQRLLLDGYRRFKAGAFPTLTEPRPGAEIEPLQYRLKRPITGISRLMNAGAKQEEIELDLLDPSGEYFSTPELLMADNEEAASFRKSLETATGLMCIIDPDRTDGSDYFELLFQNFTQLSRLRNPDGGGSLDIPVAICVAKADQYLDAFDNPQQFLRRKMGKIAFGTILTYCKHREFFAFSAVGQGNVITDENGTYKPKGEPVPERVFEPFAWLLENEP